MAAPWLQAAQFADDNSLHRTAQGLSTRSLPVLALGAEPDAAAARRPAGVAPDPLAGALYSFSLSMRTVSSNRSTAPRWLVHRLAREGDWVFPGRVALPIAGGSSSEGLPMRAISAGRTMWAAVTEDGGVVACIFPCLRLVPIVPRAANGSRYVDVTVRPPYRPMHAHLYGSMPSCTLPA